MRIFFGVIQQNSSGGSIQIVVLTAFDAPDKSGQTANSEQKGERDQVNQDVHEVDLLKEFRITARDDPDMASAAMKGVTNPQMARGIATLL